MLEDGTSFEGDSFGASKEAMGPLILNTAVVGYQEAMTDAANAGKILVFTYPLIGNYGINEKFNESGRAWVSGIVIKESSRVYSNWQAKSSLEDFLKKEGVAAVSGVDTRTLAVKLRNDGEMWAVISGFESDKNGLLSKLNEFKKSQKKSMLADVSVKKVTPMEGKGKKVVVLDLGISRSFVRQLSASGFEVTLVPYNTLAEDILKLKPSGVVISNGPEEDAGLSGVADTVKQLLGEVWLLGIAAGHQVIARALAAKIIKMKLGHRGVNYPLICPDSFKGAITVQNHGLVVNEASLGKDVEVLERNLNDNTIEKLRSKKLKFISIQYYPSSPGFDEIHPVFREFMNLTK